MLNGVYYVSYMFPGTYVNFCYDTKLNIFYQTALIVFYLYQVLLPYILNINSLFIDCLYLSVFIQVWLKKVTWLLTFPCKELLPSSCGE